MGKLKAKCLKLTISISYAAPGLRFMNTINRRLGRISFYYFACFKVKLHGFAVPVGVAGKGGMHLIMKRLHQLGMGEALLLQNLQDGCFDYFILFGRDNFVLLFLIGM